MSTHTHTEIHAVEARCLGVVLKISIITLVISEGRKSNNKLLSLSLKNKNKNEIKYSRTRCAECDVKKFRFSYSTCWRQVKQYILWLATVNYIKKLVYVCGERQHERASAADNIKCEFKGLTHKISQNKFTDCFTCIKIGIISKLYNARWDFVGKIV